MIQISLEAKKDFGRLDLLTYGHKIPQEKILFLEETKSAWLNSDCDLFHKDSPEENVFLKVTKRKINAGYRIMLFCKDFMPLPYFKFDSDGPSHRNPPNGNGLKGEAIDTPHFNTYDQNGISIAIQYEELVENAKSITSDVGIGLPFFCKISNCVLDDGNYPHIEIKAPSIDVMDPEEILTENIDFE